MLKANIALAAWENGYFPDKMERPDIDELKGAIKDELFGEKKYAFQQGKESVVKDIEELEAALDRLDIDYTGMTASELETAYADDLLDLYNVRLKASPVRSAESSSNTTDRMPSNTIISQTDSGVKSYQNANDPRGAYYKDIIYLFIYFKKPMHQHLCMKRRTGLKKS